MLLQLYASMITKRVTRLNFESTSSSPLSCLKIWKKIENERVSHKDLVRDNNHHQLEGKRTRARLFTFSNLMSIYKNSNRIKFY